MNTLGHLGKLKSGLYRPISISTIVGVNVIEMFLLKGERPVSRIALISSTSLRDIFYGALYYILSLEPSAILLGSHSSTLQKREAATAMTTALPKPLLGFLLLLLSFGAPWLRWPTGNRRDIYLPVVQNAYQQFAYVGLTGQRDLYLKDLATG